MLVTLRQIKHTKVLFSYINTDKRSCIPDNVNKNSKEYVSLQKKFAKYAYMC